MPITYKVAGCRNPKFPDAKYYKGTAVKTGELNFEKLAQRINDSTTVTTSDCYAVLKSMKQHIIEALYEGQVVVLDDLGRFQVSPRQVLSRGCALRRGVQAFGDDQGLEGGIPS